MTTPYEEGNPNAPLLIIAEAPGSVEIRMGRPLAGPSGEVFNDCLHAAGLIRHDCYILNVWPYQVVKDKAGNFYMKDRQSVMLWHNKKGFTDDGWADAQQCLEKAKKSGAVQVLTMGVPALGLALDKRPIMKWRGSPLWSERIGKKIIPTIHPAATLHGTYLWRYHIIADMVKAKRHMAQGPKLILPDRKYFLNPTFEDIMDYMSMCQKEGSFATDLEVINHQVNCFCLAPNNMEAMVVPVADEYGNAWWHEQEEMAIWRRYAELMQDAEVAKINQNLICFDMVFLLDRMNIFTYGRLLDNMIAQKILYPEFNKGLDFQCSVHTDEPYYKDEGKMWKGTGGDIEQWWTYNGKDGCIAYECWDKLAEEMDGKGYWPTYERVANRARFLAYMSIRGIRVDHDKLARVHAEVSAKLEAKEAELAQVAKYPFNVASPKQCAIYFYEVLGYTPYHNRDGGVTTDDKAMSRIYRKYNCPEAKLVQEIRALNKLKGTYLDVTFDADARLRCSWDATGTKFGRLSSSKTIFGTGMNLQNLHPEFKEFLVADEEPLI